MKSSIAEEHVSALETIEVINMGQYSGSNVKCSVLGHYKVISDLMDVVL